MIEQRHSIVLIVLAAGQSRRFGATNKLMAEVDGEALIARVLCELVGAHEPAIAQLSQVVVVVPPASAKLLAAIESVQAGVPMQIVQNDLAATGMGSSIACAVAALDDAVTGVLITPADMPSLSRAHVAALMAAFLAAGGDTPVHAMFSDGTPTSPMVWPRRCFAALMELTGDVGGRSLLGQFSAIGVSIGDDGALADIDTADELAAWQGRSHQD